MIRRSVLPLLIALAMALRLDGLDGHLEGPDSWRQTDTAAIARNFLDDGAQPSPAILWPRVDWGQGPGYVEAEFQLYSYVVSLLYRVLGEDPLIGLIVSLAVTAATCFVFHRIARRFLDEWPAVMATAVFALTPVVFRYSRAFMPDPTALLFYAITVERYLAFLETRGWRPVVASAAAMAIAILVKPTTVHLGLVLILLTLREGGFRTLFSARPVAFAVISLLPAAAYYWHAARIHLEYGNTFGVISGGDSKWGGPDLWFDQSLYETLWRIERLYVTGYSGMALALLGIAFHRRPRFVVLCASWIGTLFLYYLIVARYAGFEGRGRQYHIYAALPFALAIGGGLSVVLRAAGSRGPLLLTAAFVVIGAEHVRQDILLLRQAWWTPLRPVGVALAERSAPADRVVVLSPSEGFETGRADNYEQPNIFFHARRKGVVLAADRQTGEHLREAVAACDARWFVNYHDVNTKAAPSFWTEIASRMTPAATVNGYTIYSIER